MKSYNNARLLQRTLRTLAALVIAGVLVIGACDQTLSSGGPRGLDTESGTLSISIGTLHGLNLLPDISMTPTRYEISGLGPNEDSFSVETGQGSVVVGDLTIGTWTVTVDAYNETDDHIGTGFGTVTVTAGEVTGLSIAVRPLEGPGTLSLEVRWESEDVDEPHVAGDLIAYDGAVRRLEFSASGEEGAAFEAHDIESGYYTLAVQLYDADKAVGGAVTSARVVQDARTAGEFEFYDIGQDSGGVDIVITPDLDEPLEVAISGAENQLLHGSRMSVSAATENAGSSEVFYAWYINGSSVGSGSEIEIGADLAVGTYRLDVVARTGDGRRWGSASHAFSVVTDAGGDADESDSLDGPEVGFLDTFEHGAVDTDKWRVGTWSEHGGQLSRDRVYVQDDKLVMVFEYDSDYYQETGLFKSSAIQSVRDDFRYGRWEASLKPTDVDGVLPTMYTIDWRDPELRTRQEIDIEFVTVNISDDYSEVHFAVHGADYDSWDTQVELPFNPADDFHVWGFDITEDRIQWFVDDIVLYEYWYDEQPGVIDAPYSLKFNFWSTKLEDGGSGNWIQGPPEPDTELYYYIDWVRFIPYE